MNYLCKDHIISCINHAKILQDRHSYDDATNAHQNAMLLSPDLVNVHINLHYFGLGKQLNTVRINYHQILHKLKVNHTRNII